MKFDIMKKKLLEYNEIAEINDKLDDIYQRWDFLDDELNEKGDVILDILHRLEIYRQTLASQIQKEALNGNNR